jgi:hypothetical protein
VRLKFKGERCGMERGDFDAHVSPTERKVPNDPERMPAAPRFDDKSVRSARPAVPLTLRGTARTWPIVFVVRCVLAGVGRAPAVATVGERDPRVIE